MSPWFKPAAAAGGSGVDDWWLIEPRQNSLFERVREVWAYRNLFWYFASKELASLYRRTRLGWVWLLLRILGPIGLNSAIFGGVLDVSSGSHVPYFLFFLCGTLTWTLIDRGLLYISRSMERNQRLVTKVYFPRMILPIAGAAPALIYLLVLVVVLVGTLSYYRYAHGVWYITAGVQLFGALAAVALSLLLLVALGLFTSVLQARYRDLRYGLRYVTSLWFYLTPVIYPLSRILNHLPPEWQWIVGLNPMVPVVELFKWSTLGEGTVRPIDLTIAISVIAVTGVAGIKFFTQQESASVDKM